MTKKIILKILNAALERMMESHQNAFTFYTCNEIWTATRLIGRFDLCRAVSDWYAEAFHYCEDSFPSGFISTIKFHFDKESGKVTDNEANKHRLMWIHFLILWVESGELDHTFSK